MGRAAHFWRDLEFRAMGTHARILWSGVGDELGGDLAGLIADLETRWTRFDPTSELMSLNARPGRPVQVSPLTFDVISLAVAAWRATGGHFDPTGRRTLAALGYRSTFAGGTDPPDVHAGGALAGCAAVELDPLVRAVTLPDGVELDLGGIGKGRAADLAVDMAVAAGAAGVCVDLGGDLRAEGPGPYDGAWEIAFDDEAAAAELGRIRFRRGAVATSTIARRRWNAPDGTELHHLLDPATGRPVRNGTERVTVVAAEASGAEVAAKAALVAGPGSDLELLAHLDVAGVIFPTTGPSYATPAFSTWCTAAPVARG